MSLMNDPLVSIVVPTCNRLFDLSRCLNALSRQDCGPAPFEVIIVDDHSDEVTWPRYEQLVRAMISLNVKFARLPNCENGPAYARNRGIDLASGEIIGFLDDDSVPASNWVATVVDSFERHPSAIAITGPIDAIELRTALSAFRQNHYVVRWARLLEANQSQRIEDRFGLTRGSGLPLVDYLAGGNSAIRSRVLMRVGGFDTFFTMMHDTELALRLLQEGHLCVFVPEMQIKHSHTKSLRIAMAKSFSSGQYHYHLRRKHPLAAIDRVIRPLRPFKIVSVSWGFIRSLRWRGIFLMPIIFWLEYLHQLGYGIEAGINILLRRSATLSRDNGRLGTDERTGSFLRPSS